jgi:hypothetical protein
VLDERRGMNGSVLAVQTEIKGGESGIYLDFHASDTV